MSPRGDDQLVAAARRGDEAAFADIVRKHEKALLRYAGKLLRGTGHDAEDVVQDVFVNAHRALNAGDQRPLELKAWLYRMTRNRTIDVLRRKSPTAAPLDDVVTTASDAGRGDPAAVFARRDKVASVMADLAALPEQQTRALLLRELEGLSHEEVARELDVTEKASRMLVVRARDNLVKAQSARDTSCHDVREDVLVAHDKKRRPAEHTRRHLGDCRECRTYRAELKGIRRRVHAVAPGPAILFGLGLGKLALGGVSTTKAAATAAAAVLVTATAGVAIVDTEVLKEGEPAPRIVPGSKYQFGTKIVRGGKLPPGTAQVETTVVLPATGQRRKTTVRIRCPEGLVAVNPVPAKEGTNVGYIRGERIENFEGYGKDTYVDWTIFWGKRGLAPKELRHPIGLVCSKHGKPRG